MIISNHRNKLLRKGRQGGMCVSISDNFEINVSKNGIHYCKIELGPQAYDNKRALDKLNELKNIFGSEYELELIRWVCYGKIIKDDTSATRRYNNECTKR